MSTMRRQNATHDPAALPRPGPTRIPWDRAVVHEVPDDEEVCGEPHRLDDLELVFDALAHMRCEVLAVAQGRPLVRELAEVALLGLALGHREARELWLTEVDLDVGPLRDPQRVVTRLGDLREEGAHFDRGLQVVLGPGELEPIGLVDLGVGLHAQQRVVGLGVTAQRVMAVVRGEQRGIEGPGDLDQLRVGALLFDEPVVLHLDEQVIPTEDVLQARRGVERPLLVAVEETLQDVTAEAPGGRDDPLVVVGEDLPVHLRLLVVALEVRAAGELDEVAVSGAVLGQRSEVVVGLAPALDLATGVVDLAPASHRSLGAVLERLVQLGADDRHQPGVACRLVHRQHAVHVPVIGDPDRGLAVRGRGGDDLADPRGTVEHRVLGVHVQVGEGLRH